MGEVEVDLRVVGGDAVGVAPEVVYPGQVGKFLVGGGEGL